jgi:hypothetical protein
MKEGGGGWEREEIRLRQVEDGSDCIGSLVDVTQLLSA